MKGYIDAKIKLGIMNKEVMSNNGTDVVTDKLKEVERLDACEKA